MGTQLPPRKRAHLCPPDFWPMSIVAKWLWTKMPLGTEVNVGPGDVVLDGVAAPPKRGTAPSFRFMSIVAKRLDEDATWYGSRPRPRPHRIRRGPIPPRTGHSSRIPLFGPCLLWPRGRPSQLLLSSCFLVSSSLFLFGFVWQIKLALTAFGRT